MHETEPLWQGPVVWHNISGIRTRISWPIEHKASDETTRLMNIIFKSDPYESNQTIENINGTKIKVNTNDIQHKIIFINPSS
jgi:hypothetical protein